MTTEIRVPALGEAITEATVTTWFKRLGDAVAVDEPILELETDKVTLEVNAPTAGTLTEIAADVGIDVQVGALLGVVSSGDTALAASTVLAKENIPVTDFESTAEIAMSPAARKLVSENNLDPDTIQATGKGRRLTKGDVLAFIKTSSTAPSPNIPTLAAESQGKVTQIFSNPLEPREERVKMTRLRQRISEQLKNAQNTAAILTTFNEIDVSAVAAIRAKYRDSFEETHGVRLGLMSFFVKASIVALKEIPAVNAEIDGKEIVYKNHYDIGVAVGTELGIVVPVLRDADRMNFSSVEKSINKLGLKARDGKLTIDEMAGGTFTITNGGIYGSMLSTPILNAPQSGILGMHKIIERPVAINGEVVIRPMMYVALSYDHRIIDGREAVNFLYRVKECIEDPQRIMLNI